MGTADWQSWKASPNSKPIIWGYGMYCKWSLFQYDSGVLRENPTCYYPWYMQICSNRCFYFFFPILLVVFCCFVFLPVQIDTHAGLKGQEVTCSLLPLDYWPHGLVCQGVTGHSVGGGGGSGRCLFWEMRMLLFLSAFLTFPSAAELLHLKKKKKAKVLVVN